MLLPSEPQRSAFDLLALVTSVGSGEALSTVLSVLPDLPSVALLIGQHLGAEGALGELLRCQPRWPVRWAQRGTRLEAGQVYVGLPYTALEVQADHRCRVTPLQDERAAQPLDTLLMSLARHYGPRVLLVVLAGTGHDGVSGARAVRQAGGTVLAQAPERADQASLPSRVIEAGAADRVVPLGDLGRLVSGLLAGTPVPDEFPDERAPLGDRWQDQDAHRSFLLTEDALHASEGRLDTLTEQFPGGAVFVVDHQLQYMTAYGEALTLAGYRPEDLLGRRVAQVVGPEAAEQHEALYRRALAGEPFDLEHAAHGRTFLTRGVPLRTAAGHIYAVLAVSYDITERKRTEDVLRESEERYRSLFTSMDGACAVVEVTDDDHGVGQDFLFLQVNPAFMTQTGMPYPVGRWATELLGAPNPNWARTYSQVARSGVPVRFEDTEATLGRLFDLYVFRLGEEGSRRVAVVFTDITERRRVDAALHASEARFRAVAHLVPDLLWESGPDGATTWYNERWLAFTGQTQDQATGWGWMDAVHPEDRPASARQYREAVVAGHPLRLEHRIHHKGGEYRWFAVDNVPLTDEHGQVLKMYGAATDIHVLRTLNTVLELEVEERTQRLADLNSELRLLATASSQEINEPLRRLRGFLQLLEQRIAGQLDDKTRRYFEVVRADAQRAERLAEEFKGLTSLEHRELNLTLVPLAPLVVQVRSDLAPSLIGRPVRWAVDHLPVVTGDAMLLRQALTELLHHGLKLVPSGVTAQVDIKTTAEQEGINMRVAVGPVVAGPADLSGDGLATARWVMQRHGGTLGLDLRGEHLHLSLQWPAQRA